MNIKNIFLIFIIFTVFLSFNTVAAFDGSNETLVQNFDENLINQPQTITAGEIDSASIQDSIDDAKDGDTIVLSGKNYSDCHFFVDKKLTIKSNNEVALSSNELNQSIFYLSSQANGSIIDGFSLRHTSYNGTYGIIINQSSDIIIRNCIIESNELGSGILLENTKNIIIENTTISNAYNGINIVNSTDTLIGYCTISNNQFAGIHYSGNGKNLKIIHSNIIENYEGIILTSSDNINILSNYIAFNKDNGVYVDNNITKIEIKGNFFNQNINWEVFNDFHVKNLINNNGDKLEIIDNNYVINYPSGSPSFDMDRPVWTQIYEYKPGSYASNYIYDEEYDRYIYVGDSNGDYYGHQWIMFLGHIFQIDAFMSCPNTYISPGKVWYKSGNYELILSNITQIKKGVYSISVVDIDGNVASDLSSIPVTFYLNRNSNSSTPLGGEIYKTVMMKNGTATVKFELNKFNGTNNIITAVLPTSSQYIDDKISKSLEIDDEDIPYPAVSKITSNNLNIKVSDTSKLKISLKDISGNPIVNKKLTITINGVSKTVMTNQQGIAQMNVKYSKEGIFKVTASFDGDDEYSYSKCSSKIVVSKKVTAITAPKKTFKVKATKKIAIALKTGKTVIKNKKITVKVNGKTYSAKTNSKGIATVKIKLTKKGTYKYTAKFAGDSAYKASSKTGKIVVKK